MKATGFTKKRFNVSADNFIYSIHDKNASNCNCINILLLGVVP